MDVTKNSQLRYLSLVDNNLTSINIKNNKKLQILQVNGNKKLKSLNIKKNTKLTSLNVGLTGLTSINTSKNTKLYDLSVYKTKISKLSLKKNKKLYEINYYKSKIKKLSLPNKHMRLDFLEVKPGTTIKLKNIIGTGYKLAEKNIFLTKGSYKFSASKSTIKLSSDCLGGMILTLKKGKKEYSIYIYTTI